MYPTDSELSLGSAEVTVSLPFFQGGSGLTSATRIREGAHWASWANCLKMARQSHPAVVDTTLSGLVGGPVRCFEAVRRCAQSLIDAGFEPPSLTGLSNSQEVVFTEDPEPHEPNVGWQKATKCFRRKFMEEQHWMTLTGRNGF